MASTIKLGDAATFVNGYPFKPETWTETGLPIIRIQNLNNPEAPYNHYSGPIPEKYVVRQGDILISWSASLGAYEWKGEDAYLNQHIFKVVFDKCVIDKHFLRYAVESKLAEMEKDAHGATMRHIVKKDFDNTQIPYPSIAEQEKIVAELDCLTGIIEKKKQQLEELDKLARSIFYEMFGDPITNEKGWGTRAIQEVAPQTAYKGNIPSHNGKYWLLNLDMVEAQTGTILDEVLFDEKEIGGSTTTFNEEMVLYSKLRPYLNKVVLPMKPGYGTSELVPLLPDKSILNRVFLAYLLRSHSFVAFISLKVAGAKMPRVSLDVFRRFPVILPPLALQNEFAKKIETIEKQKELVKRSIVETETLFNSRMDFWFNN